MAGYIPEPTPLSQPFWDGCRAGKLRIQRCDRCGTHLFYPVHMCGACGSLDISWVDASGRGTVYSLTTLARADGEDAEPRILALVRLEEGPTMMSNLVGEAAGTVAIGDAVAVEFRPLSDEIWQAVFHKA
jgi:uncharacterized OB-fold protein